MNDMISASIVDVLGKEDSKGLPRVFLYEIFEKHGKALQKPFFAFSSEIYPPLPVTEDQTRQIEDMLGQGTLTRGPGEKMVYLGGHAQKLSLTKS